MSWGWRAPSSVGSAQRWPSRRPRGGGRVRVGAERRSRRTGAPARPWAPAMRTERVARGAGAGPGGRAGAGDGRVAVAAPPRPVARVTVDLTRERFDARRELVDPLREVTQRGRQAVESVRERWRLPFARGAPARGLAARAHRPLDRAAALLHGGCRAATSVRSCITSSWVAVPVTSAHVGATAEQDARRARRRGRVSPRLAWTGGMRQRGLTRKWARRFLAQQLSVFSPADGRSSP